MDSNKPVTYATLCPTGCGDPPQDYGVKFVLLPPDELATLKRDARIAKLINGWIKRAETPPTDNLDYVKGFAQAHEDIRSIIEQALVTEDGPIVLRTRGIEWVELKFEPAEKEAPPHA